MTFVKMISRLVNVTYANVTYANIDAINTSLAPARSMVISADVLHSHALVRRS